MSEQTAGLEKAERAELERIAAEDPESWAAIALEARAIALEHLRGLEPSKGIGRAVCDLQYAEQLERQVLRARYRSAPEPDEKPDPRENPIETDNGLRERLRAEHAGTSNPNTTTGTDTDTDTDK